MEYYLPLIGIAIGLFVTTNIDDVFILLGFFSDSTGKPRQIVMGQYLGIAALYGVSVTGSLIALVIAPAYVGLLGLIPVVIGVKKIGELSKGADDSDEGAEHPPATNGRSNILAVAAVTMANGADNISIYTPFFATRSGVDIALMGVTFTIITMMWLIAAYWLVNHRRIGIPIRRYGHKALPFILVALGIFILHEAGSFELLG